MSICNPIAPAIGRRLVWMPGSKSERSKSFGAMGMRLGWPNRASGSCVSMRSPPSRSWSVDPIRRAIPGSIEQQEFDYTRHGTVNMLVFLVVHTGLMELVFLAKNDHEHYLPELELFHQHHKELRGVFLIQDGGPSHIAGATRRYFAESRGVVETSLYACQRFVVKPSGNPHSCVQALLPETRVLEESGGIQDACLGFVAGIQPSVRPPL